MVQPQSTEEREKEIQAGRHYCEMLPIEYVPTPKYMETYREALRHYAKPTAKAVGTLADKIMQKKGAHVVLVSLARAGTPIGILLKHFLRQNYHLDVPHYSISIIRGRGIDQNAMKFLLGKYRPEDLLFVDGWVGKGAILRELQKEISAYPGVSPELAVLADPANVTELCGTHEDILIPSSCLNCTVSGLVSRTFLRGDIIGENDFHGAVYYGELEHADLSYNFIEAIEKEFSFQKCTGEGLPAGRGGLKSRTGTGEGLSAGREGLKFRTGTGAALAVGSMMAEGKNGMPVNRAKEPAAKLGMDEGESHKSLGIDEGKSHKSLGIDERKSHKNLGIDEVKQIAREFGITDINLVKPGIGETTRVLLRRVPWKVLVRQDCKNDKSLAHILRLAEEKNVPVAYYPLKHYKSCGIIKKLADA